ncbi:MAG: FCD domain-containing protein [Polyangiales bacterium]
MENARPRAVEDVTRRVREGILRGEFATGSDLPGERELSRRFGVSRLTLRAGISRLEVEGLVRPVHGSGTRVLDFRESAGVELLAHLVALGPADGGASLSLLGDLLELRRVLAVEAVGLAAERATPDEVASLRAHLDAQAECVDDPARWIAADLTFARRVARATQNTAVVLVTNTIVRMMERQPGIELAFMADPRATLLCYRRLVTIIEARDGERARRLTRRLLERLDRRVLAALSTLAPRATEQ